MKTLLARMVPALLLVSVMSCHDHDVKRNCRIGAFYWEDQWHKAVYSSSGRLTALVADSSKILFYYDGSDRLVSAEIYKSDPDPAYKFEFVHGPLGIVETHERHPSPFGIEYTKSTYSYLTPNQIDYVVVDEYGIYPDPTFTITLDITYSGSNVKEVYGTSDVIHTRYTASSYDKKENPFRALAVAVGNPAFFPVAFDANFPTLSYGIPVPGMFSRNNPIAGKYEIVGSGLDPEIQKFKYDYTGSIPHTIEWFNSSYGTTESALYKFKYSCGFSAE